VHKNEKCSILWRFVLVTLLPTGWLWVIKKFSSQTQLKTSWSPLLYDKGTNKDSSLTLWELAYDIFILRFRPKKSSFRLRYWRLSSSADCHRELFKGSNGSNRKKLEDLPRLLRLLPGLQSISDRRNSCAKSCAFRCFYSENPQKQPDAKELNML